MAGFYSARGWTIPPLPWPTFPPPLSSASIEILPKQLPTVAELGVLLPRGTRVYLTDIGPVGIDEEMLTAARRLQDVGCIPVPHLAARRIISESALEARVGLLAEDAGVTDVLVIGGGVNPPAGPFTSSMDLLETGILDRCGITDLAIARHPEGNPEFLVFRCGLKKDFIQRTARSCARM